MCVVDKPPKIIRRPVDMRRRKPVHTLITPSIAAGGLNPRHNLSDRDPQFRQARKFLHCAGPGPFPCEGTDVQLIDDLIIDRNSRPVRILPWKSAGIDNLRGAVNTLRLKARGRVGKRPVSVETIGIPAANSSLFDKGGEIAGGLGCQRKRNSALVSEKHFHVLTLRRPDAKMRASPNCFRADREPTLHFFRTTDLRRRCWPVSPVPHCGSEYRGAGELPAPPSTSRLARAPRRLHAFPSSGRQRGRSLRRRSLVVQLLAVAYLCCSV